MTNIAYPPEGGLTGSERIKTYCRSLSGLERAKDNGVILEGKAFRCDENHDLYVRLPNGMTGVIPFNECVTDLVRDGAKEIAVISRVGKHVCFKVIGTFGNMPLLSRRLAQEECMESCISYLESGDIIDAVITHMEPFGAFCDIGCGIVSLLPIDAMSVSRIAHPSDRFYTGQKIKVVVKTPCDNDSRLTLTHKELLGTWEENAMEFSQGNAVTGIVRSVEKYGVFVELAPNFAGLAEYTEGYETGDAVSVYIKNIIPRKMKVKLVIIDKAEGEKPCHSYDYKYTTGNIGYWKYSPDDCFKTVETVFQNKKSNRIP